MGGFPSGWSGEVDRVPFTRYRFIHSAYHTTSAIDLSVASPTIALDFQWSAHDDLCGSDHFPIFLTSHTEADTTRPAFNFKKANWNLFGDLCTRSIDQKIFESDCPVELFTEKNYRGCQGSHPSLSWREKSPESPLVLGRMKTSNPGQEEGPKKIF